MNAFFRKKMEIPLLVIVLVILTVLVLLANALAISVNAPYPIVVLSGSAGGEGQAPDTAITWNLVYMDFESEGARVRMWSCANPDDPFYADWPVEGTYDGLLKDCMQHAYSIYP